MMNTTTETQPVSLRWQELHDKIDAAAATVAVIGLGYVGLPLVAAFAERGFHVIGFDTSAQRVADLLAGKSYILDIPSETIAALLEAERLTATTNAGDLAAADAIIICVPTPCERYRQPDLSYIEKATRAIKATLRPGHMIILESTTYPGTTEELMIPILEESGLHVNEDFLVAFSPERIDPGNPQFDVKNTPKVVGGFGPDAGKLACALYGKAISKIVPVDTPREAEMVKLIENTFRHVNIALVNELAVIARKMGINIWQAIEAASSKPFGFMPFYPGPGVGGHCIPVDPHYLSWKAREMGLEISFIELAERINHSMPEQVVRLTIDTLNQAGKAIKGARVVVLGLSYKKNIDDLRESPSLSIIELLRGHGADIFYHDPYHENFTLPGTQLSPLPITPATLRLIDAVIIVTDHDNVDYNMLAEHAPLIIDTRNRMREYHSEKIIRL